MRPEINDYWWWDFIPTGIQVLGGIFATWLGVWLALRNDRKRQIIDRLRHDAATIAATLDPLESALLDLKQCIHMTGPFMPEICNDLAKLIPAYMEVDKLTRRVQDANFKFLRTATLYGSEMSDAVVDAGLDLYRDVATITSLGVTDWEGSAVPKPDDEWQELVGLLGRVVNIVLPRARSVLLQAARVPLPGKGSAFGAENSLVP